MLPLIAFSPAEVLTGHQLEKRTVLVSDHRIILTQHFKAVHALHTQATGSINALVLLYSRTIMLIVLYQLNVKNVEPVCRM